MLPTYPAVPANNRIVGSLLGSKGQSLLDGRWTLAYHRFLPNSQAAIPMYPELTSEQQEIVVQRIADFYRR